MTDKFRKTIWLAVIFTQAGLIGFQEYELHVQTAAVREYGVKFAHLSIELTAVGKVISETMDRLHTAEALLKRAEPCVAGGSPADGTAFFGGRLGDIKTQFDAK